jgi:hypothetical protein
MRACLQGFRETFHLGLLARAFWIALPLPVRSVLRPPADRREAFRKTLGV